MCFFYFICVLLHICHESLKLVLKGNQTHKDETILTSRIQDKFLITEGRNSLVFHTGMPKTLGMPKWGHWSEHHLFLSPVMRVEVHHRPCIAALQRETLSPNIFSKVNGIVLLQSIFHHPFHSLALLIILLLHQEKENMDTKILHSLLGIMHRIQSAPCQSHQKSEKTHHHIEENHFMSHSSTSHSKIKSLMESWS